MITNNQQKLFIDHMIDKYEALPLDQYKNVVLNFRAALINDHNQVFMNFDNNNIYFTSLDFSDPSHKNKDILATALNKTDTDNYKFSHQNAIIMDYLYSFYELNDH